MTSTTSSHVRNRPNISSLTSSSIRSSSTRSSSTRSNPISSLTSSLTSSRISIRSSPWAPSPTGSPGPSSAPFSASAAGIGLVLGIIGITKANGANNAYKCGDYDLARSVNNSARTLTILSLVFDGIGILFNIAFLAD